MSKRTKVTTRKTTKTKTPRPPTPEQADSIINERISKTIDRVFNPPPKPVEFRGFTPISSRITKAMRLLSLIVAAAESDGDGTSREDLQEAIADAAIDAHNQLYWISTLSASIGNLPAPDASELLAAINEENPDEDEMDAFCRDKMSQMLAGGAR